MLNINKYEKELRKYGTHFAITKEGVPVNCDLCECSDCLLGGGICYLKRMEWLLQEYKQPILTDEEKVITKNIIKAFEQFNKKPVYISKIEYYSIEGQCFLEIKYEDDRINTPNFKNDELFKGMELRKEYTLEELGL